MKRNLSIFVIISIFTTVGIIVASMIDPSGISLLIGGLIGSQTAMSYVIPRLSYIPKETYGSDWVSWRIVVVGILFLAIMFRAHFPTVLAALLTGIICGVLGVLIDMRNLRFIKTNEEYAKSNFNTRSGTPKA